MSSDIKLSNAQISKITQSGRFLCGILDSLGNISKRRGQKAITDLAIPSAKAKLSGLESNMASNATSNIIDKFGRKITEQEAVRAGRRFN